MRSLVVVACLAFAGAPLHAAASARAREASASSSTASAKTSHHKKGKRHRRPKETGQKAPTADRVAEIQSALSHGGYYEGEPNGKWDSNTVAALQKFQSANGIDPDGKLDAPTLQKLGLGSEIAGVSAPKPVMHGSPNALPPAETPQAPISAPSTQSSPSSSGPVPSVASSSAERNSAAPTPEH